MVAGSNVPAGFISVIVPAFNAAATIGECLAALNQQTVPRGRYEIIVVDDGSQDDTGNLARAGGADRVLVKERGGYAAAARNMGIAAARGEIACFTDADCVPAPDWLARIVDRLCEDGEAVGVKGIYATTQAQIVARFVQLEYEEKYQRLATQPRINFIDFYSAAWYRRVLVANGGFDERFPNSEDRELSFRLAARGYKMVFEPSAVVYHYHAATLTGYFKKKIQNGFWTAQVVSRFPTHGVDDSYTPQVVKLQIGLMGLFWLSLAAALLLPWSGLLALALLAVFLFTTLPFVRSAWRRDPTVALLAPFLLAVRATALGFGYVWGTLRPVRGIDDGEAATIGGLKYLVKRGLDLLAGGAGLLLTLLAAPVIALLPGRRQHGSIFCRRTYIGQHGNAFSLLRFTPGRLAWLPQSWNLLKGEVSLVGPRAEDAATVARYEDWHRRRLAVKPGLISPLPEAAASAGAPSLPLDERVRLELQYIEVYSLRRDLALIGRRLRSFLAGSAAAPPHVAPASGAPRSGEPAAKEKE